MNKTSYIGRFSTKIADGFYRCELCPRECELRSGQRGFCFVREGSSEGVLLTTYGRSSGFCIDPIEKKPLNHFYPGSPVLSFGTAGCNLGCRFCQNWDISKAKKDDRLQSVASPKEIAQLALDKKCKSVAFTYNDPVIFAEYAIDTAVACHEVGLKTVAVTAGYITKRARPEFYEVMDAANIDLKGFTEAFYQKQTLSHLKPVLETLKWVVHQSKTWVEITTLLIPGLNDSSQEINEMTKWIAAELKPSVPLHFTAFHPDFKMQDRGYTPKETLLRAQYIARKNGLEHVYIGNVRDKAGSSTYCPNCKQCVVERVGYEILGFHIHNSRCAFCHTEIPGTFENVPGNWGSKREPIPF